MINDVAYILGGAGLLLIGSRIEEDSPSWLMNIWGLVLVLRGIGFFHYAVPDSSFLPFAMVGSVVLFRVSSGYIKPFFLISALLILTMHALTYGTVASANFQMLLILLVVVGAVVVILKKPMEPQINLYQRPQLVVEEPERKPEPTPEPKPEPVQAKKPIDVWADSD